MEGRGGSRRQQWANGGPVWRVPACGCRFVAGAPGQYARSRPPPRHPACRRCRSGGRSPTACWTRAWASRTSAPSARRAAWCARGRATGSCRLACRTGARRVPVCLCCCALCAGAETMRGPPPPHSRWRTARATLATSGWSCPCSTLATSKTRCRFCRYGAVPSWYCSAHVLQPLLAALVRRAPAPHPVPPRPPGAGHLQDLRPCAAARGGAAAYAAVRTPAARCCDGGGRGGSRHRQPCLWRPAASSYPRRPLVPASTHPTPPHPRAAASCAAPRLSGCSGRQCSSACSTAASACACARAAARVRGAGAGPGRASGAGPGTPVAAVSRASSLPLRHRRGRGPDAAPCAPCAAVPAYPQRTGA